MLTRCWKEGGLTGLVPPGTRCCRSIWTDTKVFTILHAIWSAGISERVNMGRWSNCALFREIKQPDQGHMAPSQGSEPIQLASDPAHSRLVMMALGAKYCLSLFKGGNASGDGAIMPRLERWETEAQRGHKANVEDLTANPVLFPLLLCAWCSVSSPCV